MRIIKYLCHNFENVISFLINLLTSNKNGILFELKIEQNLLRLSQNRQISGRSPPTYYVTKKCTSNETQMREKVSKPFSFGTRKKKSLTNYTLVGPHFSASSIEGVTLVHQFQTSTLLHETTFTPAHHPWHTLPTKNSLSSLRTRTAPHKKSAKKAAEKNTRITIADVAPFFYHATFAPVFISYFTYSELKRSRIRSRRKNYIRVHTYTRFTIHFLFFPLFFFDT